MPPKKQRPTKDRSVYDSLSDSFIKFQQNIKENSKNIAESFIALFISVVTAVSAGLLLGKYEETLLLLPGLIVLIPSALGMRGNIFAALGSRLGSALHIGALDKFSMKNTVVRDNVKANITLTIVMSVMLGVMAELLSRALGIESIGLFSFVLISFIGGLLAGLLLLLITFGTAMISYRQGWDLDNIQAPLITAIGDFVTIPFLLIAAFLVQEIQLYIGYIAIITIVVMAIAIMNLLLALMAKPDKKGFSYKYIVIQSLPILILAGFLDSMAGIIIEADIHALVAVPVLLVILPAFLEEGGNIGNILASRLSTKLHLGTLDVNLQVSKEIRSEFLISYFLAFLIFPLTAITAYYFGAALGIGGMTLPSMIAVLLLAGYILTTIAIISTFFISILSFRYGLDPDNVTIPIITSLIDLLGVISLIIVLELFGIIAV